MNKFNFRRLFNFGGNHEVEVQVYGVEKEVYREIDELGQVVSNHHMRLNREAALWLLLGGLGCWGIPILSLRLWGALLVLYVFLNQITGYTKQCKKESFSKTSDRIEEKINLSGFDQKTQESMLYQLQNVRKCIRGTFSYKNTSIFTVCMFFYGLSVAIFVDTIIVSIRDRILASL